MHPSEPRETLATGRFLELVREGRWEYAHRVSARGAVVLVPVTDDDRLVLVEQYRVPVAASVIELPAGLVGDIVGEESESHLVAARRELLEETGYAAESLHALTSGPPSAGMASEIVSFYLARGLKRMGDGGGDGHEEIVVHVVPLADVGSWLARQQRERNVMVDPKVYAGLYFAGQRSAAG